MRAEERIARRPNMRKRRVGLTNRGTSVNASRAWKMEWTRDSRRLHETVNDRGRKTFWAHCGCESNEHVHLLVELGVNAEGGKGLCSSLAKTNITQTRCAGDLEYIFDRIWYVVPCKVVNRKIPKFGGVGIVVDRLFGVLVASIIAEPHIITQLRKDERNRAFWVCDTDPHFGVHEKAMVKISDRFSYGRAGDGARFILRARDAEYS